MKKILPWPVDEWIGDDPVSAVLWLGPEPVSVAGLERWPRVGDRYVICGEPWRVAEETDRWICKREED
ncbi:MAG: hypothetical protein GY906_31725 [bacterium]|nr:hypothetical protein [bacterium]